jgi:hypothetical protein
MDFFPINPRGFGNNKGVDNLGDRSTVLLSKPLNRLLFKKLKLFLGLFELFLHFSLDGRGLPK